MVGVPGPPVYPCIPQNLYTCCIPPVYPLYTPCILGRGCCQLYTLYTTPLKKSMDFQWCLAGFGDLQLILIVFEGPLVGLCVGGWVVALEGGLMLAMAAGTT